MFFNLQINVFNIYADSYSKSCQNAPKDVNFTEKNPKIFWGRDFPDPFSVGRRYPSPYPTPQVLPLQLDSGYSTDVTIACTSQTLAFG